MVTQLNHLPEGILQLSADQLYTKVNNHTLVHLEGKNKQPVVISILQHGDEHTGWDALKPYLSKYQNDLPRSMIILFNNIEATRHNVRQLDGQPDFNRSWPCHIESDHPIAKTMQQITEIIKEHKPFASVDIHNNTGRNPHYSGINSLQKEFINLASLFSETTIYFTSPHGIQSGAFAPFCPSVTVECGQSGNLDGTQRTYDFLESLMKHEDLSKPNQSEIEQNLYKILASVKIKDDLDYGFDQHDHEFKLVKDLDHLNFIEIDKGEIFGHINEKLTQHSVMPFIVNDANNTNLVSEYFSIIGNKIVCNKKFVPAMITQKIQAIKHDCLCYIMQPI